MRIVFATTQALSGSTIVGRVIPLASQLANEHEVHLLLLGNAGNVSASSSIRLHRVGREPFVRTKGGKRRLRAWRLITNMITTALNTTRALTRLQPDTVIIIKALPHNVLGVWLWSLFNKNKRIILDVDDFELTANVLTSLTQRAAIHWAERVGAKLANHIVAATPFLADHFSQLVPDNKKVTMIPTGLSSPLPVADRVKPLGPPVLLYIGSVSLSSGHRVDLLPRILSQVRGTISACQLIIAGSGDDVAAIKAMFAAQGLANQVHWHGRFSANDIPQLIAKSTIILDPIDSSIANRAKSSFRVALAAAAGIPIVTSNIGIRPHLLPDSLHQKLFAQPADADDYARKIILLLNQPLSTEQTKQLTTHASSFTWGALSRTYRQLLT